MKQKKATGCPLYTAYIDVFHIEFSGDLCWFNFIVITELKNQEKQKWKGYFIPESWWGI